MDREYRALAQDAVLGVSTRAAHEVSHSSSPAEIRQALARASRDGQISVWLVDRHNRVVAASALPSVALHKLPGEAHAVKVALSRHRFMPGPNSPQVLAMPTHTASGVREALVVYAPGTDSSTRAGDALRHELLFGAALAVLLAAAASFLVASLVTRRVRRLASAASRIAGGDFSPGIQDRFPDEIGLLAGSIDEMRERLAVAFTALERRARLAAPRFSTASRRA